MFTDSRRNFLKGMCSTAALAAAGCTMPCKAGAKPRYALQLYSIHKIFWKNPERILADLKASGYDGVEFYDNNGLAAKALRRMCDDAGLKAMGTHLNGDVALVGDELKKTLDYAAEAGFEPFMMDRHVPRNRLWFPAMRFCRLLHPRKKNRTAV